MEETKRFGFDHAPIGLVVTRHRLIEQCNTRFGDMFGYPPEDLLGKSIAVLYPSNREFVDLGEIGLRIMRKTRRYRDQRVMQRRDGTRFWCQVHGQSMTSDDPYAHCVWSFTDISHQHPVTDLTRREREIAIYVIEGFTNKQIGQRLGISHRTVEAHRSRMMAKLEARSSAELLARLTGLPGAGAP